MGKRCYHLVVIKAMSLLAVLQREGWSVGARDIDGVLATWIQLTSSSSHLRDTCHYNHIYWAALRTYNSTIAELATALVDTSLVIQLAWYTMVCIRRNSLTLLINWDQRRTSICTRHHLPDPSVKWIAYPFENSFSIFVTLDNAFTQVKFCWLM